MKPRLSSVVAALILAVVLLFFGALATMFGGYYLKEWAGEGLWLRLTGLVVFPAGLAMAASTVWIFGSLGRRSLPLRIGGIAIIMAGSALALSAWTGVAQCATPT